jgi:hypothetical protein
MTALASEIDAALVQFGLEDHPRFGKVYAYEVDGFGSHYFMDDANIPGLLSLPYLGYTTTTDPTYVRTRSLVLSEEGNPWFFKSKEAEEGLRFEGVGGPHVGELMVWPMAIIMRAMTSENDREIVESLNMLKASHKDTFFMHETFNVNNSSEFTRPWFAWCNSLFGELMMDLKQRKPYLLTDPDYIPSNPDSRGNQDRRHLASALLAAFVAAVAAAFVAAFIWYKFRHRSQPSPYHRCQPNPYSHHGPATNSNPSWDHLKGEDDECDDAWDADMDIGKGLLPMVAPKNTGSSSGGPKKSTLVEL